MRCSIAFALAWGASSVLAADQVVFGESPFTETVKTEDPENDTSYKRRPDSFWDHIVSGEEAAYATVFNDDVALPKYGGKLDNYALRIRKNDPSRLGLDDVKQYSGYLDDNELEKHLFYCKEPQNNTMLWTSCSLSYSIIPIPHPLIPSYYF